MRTHFWKCLCCLLPLELVLKEGVVLKSMEEKHSALAQFLFLRSTDCGMGRHLCSLGFLQVCASVPSLADPVGMSQGGGQGTGNLSCTSLHAAPQGLLATIPPELDVN